MAANGWTKISSEYSCDRCSIQNVGYGHPEAEQLWSHATDDIRILCTTCVNELATPAGQEEGEMAATMQAYTTDDRLLGARVRQGSKAGTIIAHNGMMYHRLYQVRWDGYEDYCTWQQTSALEFSR